MSTLYQEAGHAIGAHRAAIAEAMVTRQYAQHPELAERFGPRGRVKCLQDAGYHLDHLAQSLTVGQPLLFVDYLAWARVMLAGRHIAVDDLVINLGCLGEALRHTLEPGPAAAALEYVTRSTTQLTETLVMVPSFITADQPLTDVVQDYLTALLAGDRQGASRVALTAFEHGASVQDIYLHVFQCGQYEIGRLWQMNQISVAQEHYCTAATQLIMSQFYPNLFSTRRIGRTLVAACIADDLHEIGLRMVSDLFELDGWDTNYLGANTPVAAILETVGDGKTDVLAISATILPHLTSVEELIAQVRVSPACRTVKIIVGGYPFNVAPELWRQLGADGSARDALSAVALATRLVLEGGAA